MKTLRRSLNNSNNNNGTGPHPLASPPIPYPSSAGGSMAGGPALGASALARPSEKVAPPQKVIKALTTHRSTNPQELSYTKGDFWYVTGERDGWYEALNPLTGSRGLVPKSDFEEFSKGGRTSASAGARQGSGSSADGRSQTPNQGHLSQISNPRSPPTQQVSPPVSAGPPRKPKQPVYAIVQYDFEAERPDELDAKKGEPIVVIAQSNHEWFVAKPIGRLGGPGLIPVAFVEIRDPATGRPIEVLPESIPMVEEWKKATADYKAAAIPLGRFDFAPDQTQGVSNSPYAPPQPQSAATSQTPLDLGREQGRDRERVTSQGSSSKAAASLSASGPGRATPIYRPEQDPCLPPGELTSLGVPSFHNESGNYWFRLQVTFLPEDPRSPAFTLSLYRTYEDFYDFQISLLDTFPFEAGRPNKGEEDQTPPERILPYMPGPVEDEIDDELTEYRREELDAYVRALIDLRLRGAGYILRHELFRAFFAAKYGDYCEEVPRPDGEGGGDLEERLADVRIQEGGVALAGGVGESNTRATSAASRNSLLDRQSPHSWGHNPSAAASRGASRGPSPLPPPIDTQRYSQGQGQSQGRRPESSGPGQGIAQGSGPTYQVVGPAPTSSYRQSGTTSAGMRTSGSQGPGAHYFSGGPSTAATSSSFSAAPGSAMSGAGGGGGGYGVGPGPGSASGSGAGPPAQPPYVKIKVYDRATDDLIALRVHPNVSHAELFDKVRARLGPEVSALRYRTSMGGPGQVGYRDIRDDRELREWMRGEDQKLVLYAEQE